MKYTYFDYDQNDDVWAAREERLFEQIFNKTHRIFYHISDKEHKELIPQNKYLKGLDISRKCPMIFLSNKKDFCIEFFEKQIRTGNWAFLHEVRLQKSLNLFNFSSGKDWKLFSESFPVLYQEALKEYKNWRYIANLSLRNFLIVEKFGYEIKKLGYDGTNTQGLVPRKNIQKYPAENIALFYKEDCKVIKCSRINMSTWTYEDEALKIEADRYYERYKDKEKVKIKLKMDGFKSEMVDSLLENYF